MRTPRVIFGILALSLASTSCLRQKAQARVFTPPPMRPARVPEAQRPIPDPPQIVVDAASIVPPGLLEMSPEMTLEMPAAPKPVARRLAPAPAPPKPVAPQVPESPVTPKLAQMFTVEERREHTRTLDETLERVNRELAMVEGKNLTLEQKEIAERVRTFRKQAEQAREQDLLTAVSLARRADLLAKDLLERLP
jgi:hypothetical protein